MKKFIKFLAFLITTASYGYHQDQKVGILFGSYGDADSKEQVKELVINTIQDPDIAPIPNAVRGLSGKVYWSLFGQKYLDKYKEIDYRSGIRDNSSRQGEEVVRVLRERGYEAEGTFGFTFVEPTVSQSLDQLRLAGVERLVVIHQGAQYSKVTTGVLFRDVRRYLSRHPEWRVEATGIRSFGRDSRFVRLLGDKVQSEVTERWGDVRGGEVCLFFPVHGVPLSLVKSGDPYLGEVNYALDALRYRFADHHLFYGFENHGEMPFVKWTTPTMHAVVDDIADEACPKVLIDPRIVYTVGIFNTAFEIEKELVSDLYKESAKRSKETDIYVASAFNEDPDFTSFLSDIIEEALYGLGDIEKLSD